MNEHEQKWRYKAIALLCAIFLAGNYLSGVWTLIYSLYRIYGWWSYTRRNEFDISNAQYGVTQPSVAIVNTLIPVLGGILIDAFGTIPGLLISTLLIT